MFADGERGAAAGQLLIGGSDLEKLIGRTPTPLDKGKRGGDASAMTDNPYAIPVEYLVDSARVPVAEQVTEQPERRLVSDSSTGPVLGCDGMAGDGDGE